MDNKTITGSPDSKRINVNENYEVEYWSKKYGVSSEELKKAVKAAGTFAEDVEKYLKNRS